MHLCMYVGETLVERIVLTTTLGLTKLMNDLRYKYASDIRKADNHRFFIDSVPSQINGFKSLMSN